MASVIEFPAGRSFIFEVRKWLVSNPNRKWRNRYEALSRTSGTLNDLIELGRTIVTFERMIHPTLTWFVEWIVSTGARDDDPYNPETFYTETINATGLWSRGGHTPVDLDVALFASRPAYTGRSGRIFYRGILGEEDIQANAGKFSLESASLVPGKLASAVIDSNISRYFAYGSNTVLRIVLIGNNGEYPRSILNITAHGVSICKTDHRYFNRHTSSQLHIYEEGTLDEIAYEAFPPPDPADWPPPEE